MSVNNEGMHVGHQGSSSYGAAVVLSRQFRYYGNVTEFAVDLRPCHQPANLQNVLGPDVVAHWSETIAKQQNAFRPDVAGCSQAAAKQLSAF